MNSVLEFAGRLHPMLVHFPIGILLIAIVLLLLAQWEKIEMSRGMMSVVLGIGSTMAVASCVTGWLLSNSGDYEAEAVELHQWMAVFLTLVSLAVWYLHHEYWLRDRVLYLVSFVVFFSLTATGHLGASLTHGSDYLVAPFGTKNSGFDAASVRPGARFYLDVIDPILQQRCAGCHGAGKQKGKLRLDTKDHIQRGGESGAVLVAGSAGDSELWSRLTLPVSHEDHMPPKEKRQPGAQELTLIKLWIESGANFERNIDDVLTSAQMVAVLERKGEGNLSDLPEENVPEANAEAVRALQREGVSVTPVSEGSNYLSVNFVSIPKAASRVLPFLNDIQQNVVWLKLSGCETHHDDFLILTKLQNLRKLSLEDTNTTDADLQLLAGIQSLTYLNLKGTEVSAAGVRQLQALPSLSALYLFETRVSREDRTALQALFKNTQLDFGDYEVPTRASDTAILVASKK